MSNNTSNDFTWQFMSEQKINNINDLYYNLKTEQEVNKLLIGRCIFSNCKSD